jgi:mono/diheme cytochrome c family protein
MNSKFLVIVFSLIIFYSCGNDTKKTDNTSEEVVVEKEVIKDEVIDINKAYMDDKGIGAITNVTIGEIDNALVEKGLEVYKTNCTACHKLDKRYIGPALRNVTERRSPEWIMNMIMNPELMLEKNALAKALITTYNAPMANQNMSEEQARAILEFFRSNDKK